MTPPELVLDLHRSKTLNIVSLREFLPLGQRIEAFALDQWQNGQWVQFAAGTGVGSHRQVRGGFITTSKGRLRITQAPVCPAIAEFGLFANLVRPDNHARMHQSHERFARGNDRLNLRIRRRSESGFIWNWQI